MIGFGKESMLTFNGELNGEDVRLLKMKIDLWIERTDDLRPVWENAREQMLKDVAEVFRTEGASMGEKWVGLSKATIRDRMRKGYPPEPILVRSGRLKNSLLGGKEGIDRVTEHYWEYGSKVYYAIYHQSRKPRKRLPRRAFLYISNKMKGDLVRNIHKYVMTGQI